MKRLILAFFILGGWLAVVLIGQRLEVRGEISLDELVSRRIGVGFVVAPILLLAIVAALRWRDLGLSRPRSWRGLLILCPPALHVAAMLLFALAAGLPSLTTIAVILVNTALIGVSEELMFRGVLYSAARERMSIWGAVWLSSLLFGAVHAANGFLTGDFAAAFAQAGAAAMTGVYLAAVRLRTGSLYPGMAIHGLWDFAVVLMSAAISVPAEAQVRPFGVWPFLVQAPLFAYGLWVIWREIRRR